MKKYIFILTSSLCLVNFSYAMDKYIDRTQTKRLSEPLKAELWFTKTNENEVVVLLSQILKYNLHGFTCEGDQNKNYFTKDLIGAGPIEYKKEQRSLRLYAKKVSGIHNKPRGTYHWVSVENLLSIPFTCARKPHTVNTIDGKQILVTNRLLNVLDRTRLERLAQLQSQDTQKAKRARRV